MNKTLRQKIVIDEREGPILGPGMFMRSDYTNITRVLIVHSASHLSLSHCQFRYQCIKSHRVGFTRPHVRFCITGLTAQQQL